MHVIEGGECYDIVMTRYPSENHFPQVFQAACKVHPTIILLSQNRQVEECTAHFTSRVFRTSEV